MKGQSWKSSIAPTQGETDAALAAGLRVARFTKGFFMFIGLACVVIAAVICAHSLSQGDLQAAGIALGAMAVGAGWTYVARRLLTGFAEALRGATGQVAGPPDPAAQFVPLEGVMDGVPYYADSLSSGNVEVWIDLPQKQMRRPQLFFETRSGPFDPAAAEWGTEQIQALFDLGAQDVDVGFHSDSIQVCFPQDRAAMTRAFAEKAVRLMISLRREALKPR